MQRLGCLKIATGAGESKVFGIVRTTSSSWFDMFNVKRCALK